MKPFIFIEQECYPNGLIVYGKTLNKAKVELRDWLLDNTQLTEEGADDFIDNGSFEPAQVINPTAI